MNEMQYRRGEIYEVKTPPTFGYPYGRRDVVMVLQNDAGEIPCLMITVVPVERVPYWAGCPMDDEPDWVIKECCPCRMYKRQLGDMVDALGDNLADAFIEMVEYELGIEIPEIMDEP